MRTASTRTTAAATALLTGTAAVLAATVLTGASVRASTVHEAAGVTGPGARGCATSWRVVAEPATPGSNQLYPDPVAGMSDAEFAPDTALSSESVLAGGDAWFFGINGYTGGLWTLHWNGRSVSRSAAGYPQGVFLPVSSGVASFDSSNDGWAISGFLPDIEPSVAQAAERWHDGRWTMTPLAVSPQPVTEDVNLTDVVSLSPGDAWAVGEFDNANRIPGQVPVGALIEHWDGTSWNIAANPASSRPSTRLVTVTAVGPDDIWAAGYQAAGKAGFLPLVEHFDGTRWTALPALPLSAGYHLGSVISVTATSDSDAWAGGFEVTSDSAGRASFLAEHWNGTSWRPQELPALLSFGWKPDEGAYLGLSAIYAASAADVWAAPLYPSYRSHAGSFLVHWDGTAWSVVPAPGPQEYGLQYGYAAIAGTGPGDVWADGYVYNQVMGTVMPQIAHLGCAS